MMFPENETELHNWLLTVVGVSLLFCLLANLSENSYAWALEKPERSESSKGGNFNSLRTDMWRSDVAQFLEVLVLFSLFSSIFLLGARHFTCSITKL